MQITVHILEMHLLVEMFTPGVKFASDVKSCVTVLQLIATVLDTSDV